MTTEDKPIIIIGEFYDGFRLTNDDEFSVWISQEELPSKQLKKFFQSLGFKVKVKKEY